MFKRYETPPDILVNLPLGSSEDLILPAKRGFTMCQVIPMMLVS
jgi:hypothetical protein